MQYIGQFKKIFVTINGKLHKKKTPTSLNCKQKVLTDSIIIFDMSSKTNEIYRAIENCWVFQFHSEIKGHI